MMDFSNPSCPGAVNSLGTANALLNTFVSSILALHCNISSPDIWPEDYGETAIKHGVDDFDFIVVGAGSAGSVIAGRLAENVNNKVLLIEAGGDPPMETEIPVFTSSFLGSEIDWYYKPHHDPQFCLARVDEYCSWHCGKVIGGSHSLNALIYFRGISSDYDTWEAAGNPSWGWNAVLPYFQKTEKFHSKIPSGSHGTHGPMNVEPYHTKKTYNELLEDAASELGHTIVDDLTDGPDVGFGPVFGTQKKGRRMSTAKAFLTHKRPNLFVMKHAIARKIIFDGDLKAKAVSVVYKNQHQFEVRARKEVIISAGSIGTPKLLMLSGIGPNTHLQALGIPVIQHLDVGMNLQDHVRIELFLRLSYKKPIDSHKEFLDAFYNQWVHRSGAYAAVEVDYTGFIATDGDPNIPDVQILCQPIDNITFYTTPYKSHLAQSLIRQVTEFDVILDLSVILLRPKSKGFLKLASTDYRDAPLIYPNFLNEKDDIRTLVRGIEALVKFEETDVIRKLKGEFLRPSIPECDAYKYRSEKYWECYIQYMTNSGFHYTGTSKMGPKEDRSAVVNSKLEVHGVKQLRVADASIMPNIVSANTNAATIMIGEKAADFVKNRPSL